MAEPVSIWGHFMDGEYNDKKLYETDNTMIIRYCGQKQGRNDKYVGVGNYFFFKNNKKEKYKFAGRVIDSKHIGIENQIHDGKTRSVNIFELVISKEPEISFRIKAEAYRHFGWKMIGQEHMSGIVKHTLL